MRKFPILMLGVAVMALAVACSIEPSDVRPGFGLSGEVHQGVVEDWSFASEIGEIFVETATPYWIPHSVTIWCVVVGDRLYLGAYDADSKHWVANVGRDPNVRLKIGAEIYEQKLVPITDPMTISVLESAYAKKYALDDEDEPEDAAATEYWMVVERG